MYDYRPKIKLKKTKLQRILDIVGYSIFILGAVISIGSIPFLPNEIPIHFNYAGVADNWGSKYFMFLLPFIGVITILVLQALEKNPHIHNYPARLNEHNAKQFYEISVRTLNLTKNGCLILFGYLMIEMVYLAQNENSHLLFYLPMIAIMVLSFVVPIIWHLVSVRKVD